MKRELRLLLLGYGNVARAFLPLLAARSEWMEREQGIHPFICGIGSRRSGFFVHPTGIAAEMFRSEANPLQLLSPGGKSWDDAQSFIQAGRAAGADALIELTTMNPENGEPALSHIRQALEAGMDVVTANKGPIAHAGETLHALARQHGVYLRYESAVVDGLPLINLAEFTLPAVGIHGFRGLLNATSGIVLGQMEQGRSLEEAIQVAQQIGVAEANPWNDLDGWDAAMKTAILANTWLNSHLTPQQIERTGIRDLPQAEIVAAAQAGTPIRLVSSARLIDGVLSATVRPERLLPGDPLSSGKDLSMITLQTEAMGAITLIEHDTGVLQTAYGVLSDLIIILRTRQEQSRAS